MKTKTKQIFWIAFALLITACGTRGIVSNPDTTIVAEVNKTVACNLQINIVDIVEASPSDLVYLTLERTGFDWTYNWSASSGVISDPSASSPSFKFPTDGGIITVSVEVTDPQGCSDKASININIESLASSSLTHTKTPNPENTSTSLPTQFPTVANTPTLTPSATNTQTPTTMFTNTPSYTATPANTSTPTLPSFQVFLKEPKDGTCVGTNNAVFEWVATRPLNTIEGKGGEYFAINIWEQGSPVIYSVSWIKDLRYEVNISDPITAFTQQVDCNSENGCFWNVDVILSNVERGSGWLPNSFTIVTSSPVREFCTQASPPPIPPTDTPIPDPDGEDDGDSGLPTRTG